VSFDQQGNITTPTILHWRDRISAKDRQAADAISKWIRPIPWQLFLTLTFPWNVRAETAQKKLRQLVNLLEKTHRADVCYVAARESKPFTYGMGVPNHFHVLLTSHAPLSANTIRLLWSRLAHGPASEHAKVDVYNYKLLGPEYCFKTINDSDGDWFLHRLEHFLPGVGGTSNPDHRTIRAARRAKEQATRFSQLLSQEAIEKRQPQPLPKLLV
jgi:hypothetical protein